MAHGAMILNFVFYILVGAIILYVGIGIVAGFNPSGWGRKFSSLSYEQGKLMQTQDFDKNKILDCTQNDYLLTLKDLKFDVKPGTSVQGGALEFVVALDFKNMVFVGADETRVVKKIKCSDESGNFNCGGTLNFYLGGCTGGLNGTQVFHFTTWEAKPAVLAAMEPTGTCSYPSISKVLDSYGQFYLSSFDVVVDDIQLICDKTECEKQADKGSCDTLSKCYWSTPILWFNNCKLCPTSTACGDYDSEQCSKCPVSKVNCRPSVLGCGPA